MAQIIAVPDDMYSYMQLILTSIYNSMETRMYEYSLSDMINSDP